MPYYPPPVTVPVAAAQADQETGTSTAVWVNPGVQHYHQSACKGWILFDGTGTISITVSYNVTSITDSGTGVYEVTWDVDFSSVNWSVLSTANVGMTAASPSSATAAHIVTRNSAGTLTDAAYTSVAAYGDQ